MSGISALVSKLQGSPAPNAPPAAPKSSSTQTGIQIVNISATSLGASTTAITTNNITNPNGQPYSNLSFQLTVIDTTGGTTAPANVNSIEEVLQYIVIKGAKSLLAYIQGPNGEFERWQHRLNQNGVYVAAPTPADTALSTQYPSSWVFSFKNWAIDPSEGPLSITVGLNTLASRAGTLNGMTSTAALTISCDFVPLSSFKRSLLVTKLISQGATGLIDIGTNVDSAMIYDMSLDVGADSNLSHTNSFYVALNGNAIIPYSDYENIVQQETNAYPWLSAPHISGFFPLAKGGLGAFNGAASVSLKANYSSAPSIGGQSNKVNLYMIEAY